MATGFPDGAFPGGAGPAGPGGIPGPPTGPPPAGPPASQGRGWTAGRVIAVVIGSVLALVSLGLLGGGGTLLWADQSLRVTGYVTTGTDTYSTTGYAIATERVGLAWGWLLTGLAGDVRLRVTAASPGRPVFVAIGPAGQVAAYLSGASYARVTGAGAMTSVSGTARPAPPQAAGIWVAKVAGTGTQVLRWTAESGDWAAVAMNPDGSAGVSVRADAGVSAPGLLRLAVELIVGGAVAAAVAAALIIVPVRLAARGR